MITSENLIQFVPFFLFGFIVIPPLYSSAIYVSLCLEHRFSITVLSYVIPSAYTSKASTPTLLSAECW